MKGTIRMNDLNKTTARHPVRSLLLLGVFAAIAGPVSNCNFFPLFFPFDIGQALNGLAQLIVGQFITE